MSSENINISSNFLDISQDGKMTLTADTTFDPYHPEIDDYVFKVKSPTYNDLRTTIQPDVIGLSNGTAKISIQVGTIMRPLSASAQIYLYDGTDSTNVTASYIRTPQIIQSSKEEYKKNFEKLNNGLDIIKNIDIYKYNLKSEEDNMKKHIGFVIGNNFKYSKEITSKENNGVDTYSFISVCCKAIQEQQEQIENLKKEIKELKGGN